MKILFVSMNSIHFRRWSDQLRGSGHELFWFDILDQGYAPSMDYITQITGWKKGFLRKRGRTFLKNKLPRLYNALVHKYDTPVDIAFAKALQEIQPDLVHSFALYVSCTPILPVMLENPHIKWAYCAWGSDLFYFKNVPAYLDDIKRVLLRVHYLFTDCERDYKIAADLGFTGTFLGVLPGGGGFNLAAFNAVKRPFNERKTIAVKGYQNRSGRALPVLQALESLAGHLVDYEVVVFGASVPAVYAFRESNIPRIRVLGEINHDALIALLGSSAMYIGNSNSDGMPNTLLEALCAGAFPIQSNPGGATAEIITQDLNGLLITDCEDVEHIATVILKALSDETLRENGVLHNTAHIMPSLARDLIKNLVNSAYSSIKS